VALDGIGFIGEILKQQPVELPIEKGTIPDGYNAERHSLFEVMGVFGDLKIMWDRTKPDEVAAAKATFDSLIKKGYAAFAVKDNDGNKGDKIKDFDPNAERIIMVGPMAGG
jgi:hypothetical protein